MPNLEASIEQFCVGDGFSLGWSITDITAADPLLKVWFTVKERNSDVDSSAIFQKILTTAPSADGKITEDGSSGTARVEVNLHTADTALMIGNRTYWFDLQAQTVAMAAFGDTKTPVRGTIVGKPQITRTL
jgi:hypothetical protein